MNYMRRFIIAIIIVFIVMTSWYGAEMMIHGESQRSAVDIFIAVVISISLSGKIEKGAEENERKREIAEKFTAGLIYQIKKREEAKDDRKDGSRENSGS